MGDVQANTEVVECFVEEHLDWSWITQTDLEGIAQLQSAVDYFDDPVARADIEQFETWFRDCPAMPTFGAVCGRDKRVRDIVAYGWNVLTSVEPSLRIELKGAVHPGWRDQRIGNALIEWQLAALTRWAEQLPDGPTRIIAEAYSNGTDHRRIKLFEGHGFSPERYFFDMHHLFARVHNPPSPPPVDGISFRPYGHGDSEAVRALHNLCFAPISGFNPVSRESWELTQSRPDTRPDLSWLAFEGDRLVGYALNSADEAAWPELGFSEGWTDRLGVHPDYRRRGIAQGLLSWSMWSFGNAGLEGAGLGIDTDDPVAAELIYHRIGYESSEMVVRLSRTIELT